MRLGSCGRPESSIGHWGREPERPELVFLITLRRQVFDDLKLVIV
jgi:hypothetical protein